MLHCILGLSEFTLNDDRYIRNDMDVIQNFMKILGEEQSDGSSKYSDSLGLTCCDEAFDQVPIEELEGMICVEDDDPEDNEEETTRYEATDVDTDENDEESEDGSSGSLCKIYESFL